jgi:ankyrin repeat protein
MTPLFIAAIRGYTDVSILLKENGSDINVKDTVLEISRMAIPYFIGPVT